MHTFKQTVVAILLCSMPAFGQVNVTSRPQIQWEDDVMGAFVKALENNRPMVVLFASDESYRAADGRNISNEARKEFENPKLQALANDAIFVVCTFDHANNTIHDEFGKRIYVRLKIELVPTVCVFSPRTDVLQEICHIEGIRSAETYLAELTTVLMPTTKSGKSDRDRPIVAPAPTGFVPKEKPEKMEAPAPATPAEAINQLSQALRAGDLSEVANLLAEPYVPLYSKVFSAARRLGAAKRRILAAMDGQFGAADDSVPYGEDDVRVRRGLQQVSAVVLEDARYPETKLCVVKARLKFSDGTTKSVEVRVIREENGWKIQPDEWLGFADQERCRRHSEFLNRLADDFTGMAKKISAGEFGSRSACQAAARELFLADEQALEVRSRR